MRSRLMEIYAYGTAPYRLDRKGRVVIPDSFRSARLGKTFFLKLIPNHRVMLFSGQDFPKLIDLRPMDFRDASLSTLWELVADPTTSRVLLPWIAREHLEVKAGDQIAVSGAGEVVLLCEYQRWANLHSLTIGTKKCQREEVSTATGVNSR